MTYFHTQYAEFRFPIAKHSGSGLRTAQSGALHAIAAHFSANDSPALVTMPTGSGKTAVLTGAPFLLRPYRVLVITPSVMVRSQIVDEFASLTTLKQAEALPKQVPTPQVIELQRIPRTPTDWEQLRLADVVVSTPNCVRLGDDGRPLPPPDLFDLILIDEAHHSPARTWSAIPEHFLNARLILFTATPYRRDRKEIRAKYIYSYSVQRAYSERIYGQLTFVPVTVEVGETADEAIARAAEQEFRADQRQGYGHALMVRTKTKKRARELHNLYSERTSLRLALITSDESRAQVTEILTKLEAGVLDGLVCVDMLGEGFNFPRLKIAALHAPHRSLALALQFIGRFARTSASLRGSAKFLAIPEEVDSEVAALYKQGAAWQTIVPNLSDARISLEEDTREILETFDVEYNSEPDLSDLSLYSFTPTFYVKIYRCTSPVDLHATLDLGANLQVFHSTISEDWSAVVFVTQERVKPRWTSLSYFDRIEYDLFIVHWHKDSNLLFINSSKKAMGLYEIIAHQFSPYPRPLPVSRVNQVLLDFDDADFFSIGMRSRVLAENVEAYRMISGTSVHGALDRTNTALYDRGHWMMRASEGDTPITLGASSSAKVWSNTTAQVPQFLKWCDVLASKIMSNRRPTTPIDLLPVGVEAASLPAGIVAAGWDAKLFRHMFSVRYLDQDGQPRSVSLIDIQLEVDVSESTSTSVRIYLNASGWRWAVDFSLETPRFYTPVETASSQATVEGQFGSEPLLAFIETTPIDLYTVDFERLNGTNFFPQSTESPAAFPSEHVKVIDWAGEDVNIRKEEGSKNGSQHTIHSFLEEYLPTYAPAVLYYDHGSGEVADFVEVDYSSDLTIRLYHCKGSKTPSPGVRVTDLYEVCGQVVRSVHLVRRRRAILAKVKQRFASRKNSRFVVGDLKVFEMLMTTSDVPVRTEIVLVQPGISKNQLQTKDDAMRLLAAADNFIVSHGFLPLRVWASE